MEGDWASRANPADLEAVASALESGRLSVSGDSMAALQSAGVGDVAGVRAFLAACPSDDARWAAWCLRRVARERRAAADRFAQSAQLVWSGHREGSQPLRDTRVALAEVCARAERSVTLATYVVYEGRESLAALAERMRELPSLRVDLYVHVRAKQGEAAEHAIAAWLARFQIKHWREGVRLPAIWYDPATIDHEGGTSMHAKCVVVDERFAFVTSANFTEAAQERNVEVGVLLDHPALAQSLCAQFQGLRERGGFRRMPGT